MMNVNERKIQTNQLWGNHNVRTKKSADLINLIHKNDDLAAYLKQTIHANYDKLPRFEFFDLNYDGPSRDSMKTLVHITSPVESLLQLAELVNDSNKVQHRIARYGTYISIM